MSAGQARARGGGPRGGPSPRWPLMAGLVGAVAADAVFGDPRRGHPVAGFGAAARRLEDLMYADTRAAGTAFAACGTGLAIGPAIAAALACRGRPAARLGLTLTCTWTVLGGQSLARAAGQVRMALAAGDLDDARRLLPSLCGRDPGHLGATQLAAAVIESVAENTSDAVAAPLLWGALGSVPALAGYRAVNTLDAMVGHRSCRYERFGWASARLDDVANVAPARLTALLASVCAPAVAGSPEAAWLAARRDGPLHPSPNAGWCEAAFAGALGLRLGGPVSFSGIPENRPVLGTGRTPEPGDISRAVRLSRIITAASTAIAAALALAR